MRFSDSFLDEIRTRLPVSEVIGRRVKLRKQGREFAGLSPFNQEKTPSFFVNDQKGRWFDFSAGKSGDIFTFLMETEGLGFPEAVERLAGEAGVSMPARDPQAEERERRRASLYEVMDMARDWFKLRLNGAEGAAARAYLTGRDIGPDLQGRFDIGYAPSSRNGLKEHLAGKGVDQSQMEAAGLLISGDDIPVSYDRFRDRVMFPITDLRNRVVGFGGRALSPDVPAKYLNSPETDLFHKGALLYNGASARKAAHDGASVVVVEGYADVVQMAAGGFDGAVAPLGTALTERQLDMLWQMADEPVLCFDGDKAGVRAAHRGIDLALPHLKPGKSLRFAMLPGGQDPDDLIRAEGREAMADVLGAAAPMIELLWARETEGEVFDTPERRAALEARLRDVVRSIGDESVRRHYEQALRDRVRAFFGYGQPSRQNRAGAQRNERGRRQGGRSYGGQGPWRSGVQDDIPVSLHLKSSALLRGRDVQSLREAVLMVTPVNHPGLVIEHLDELVDLELSEPALDGLRAALVDICAEEEAPTAERLRRGISEAGHEPVFHALEAHLKAVGYWPAEKESGFEDAEAGWKQALTLHLRNRTLNRELKDAEAALARDPSDLNLERLVDIQNQLASHEGTEALIEGFGAVSGRARPTF